MGAATMSVEDCPKYLPGFGAGVGLCRRCKQTMAAHNKNCAEVDEEEAKKKEAAEEKAFAKKEEDPEEEGERGGGGGGGGERGGRTREKGRERRKGREKGIRRRGHLLKRRVLFLGKQRLFLLGGEIGDQRRGGQ